MDKNPNATDLEQMASYILYGKDENGLNAVQRGETIDSNRRYGSFKKNDDKLLSLDEILENPMVDEQTLRSPHQRNWISQKKTTIQRPKYDKKTGELIDIGDGDIPGMTDLWDSIDKLEHWIAQLEGRIPPDENTLLFDDSYRLWRLKHTLIDLRRHQYYLKDSYKPTLHFLSLDHPKTQFYDWAGDSFYWIPYKTWKYRTDHALLHTISRDIKDYETRGEGDNLEVKWVVRRHNFDWEDYTHVRALIATYDLLYDYLYTKLDTYGRTLIWDFQRYREMTHFSEVREFLIDMKIARVPYEEILAELKSRYGIVYNRNHLCYIMAQEIPKKIAETARRNRLLVETPEDQRKECIKCGRVLPIDPMFFARNKSRADNFASSCKECEKKMRIRRGGQTENDLRTKDSTLPKVQTGQTT